jgi:hypothetical protein
MKAMFMTTATLKQRVGAFGLSIEVGAAGEEISVKLFSESPSETLWEIAAGPMKGLIINGNLLSFDIPCGAGG